jgi:hypothetical protein
MPRRVSTKTARSTRAARVLARAVLSDGGGSDTLGSLGAGARVGSWSTAARLACDPLRLVRRRLLREPGRRTAL